MKIADYEQMMAHLMRQGYNKGGYVRLKKGGRPSLAEGTFKPRLERGKKLLDYINNLSKGSIVVFPSFVWHRVNPIIKGTRYSLVMWNLGRPFV
jgi:hypothetical protein